MAPDWLRRLMGRVRPIAPLPTTMGPARTIGEVVESMREIDRTLPREDGVAGFNRMYLRVTEGVSASWEGHAFEDPEYLERLDVNFANLYFRAIEDHVRDPESCPRAWVPLMEARSNTRITPLQFALSGMNAHINHDLVIAVVDTCTELGREPKRASACYRDFVFVNRVLASVMDEVETEFKRGLLGILDKLLGRADEIAQTWSIQRAREAAWINAETLWRIRNEEALRSRFLLVLARSVGLAGRGLLVERMWF